MPWRQIQIELLNLSQERPKPISVTLATSVATVTLASKQAAAAFTQSRKPTNAMAKLLWKLAYVEHQRYAQRRLIVWQASLDIV